MGQNDEIDTLSKPSLLIGIMVIKIAPVHAYPPTVTSLCDQLKAQFSEFPEFS